MPASIDAQDSEVHEVRQLAVRMPAQQHEALKALSEATDTSMNHLVNVAVAQFLAAPARRAEIQARIEAITARHALALEKLSHL